jgi:hypothetical protein
MAAWAPRVSDDESRQLGERHPAIEHVWIALGSAKAAVAPNKLGGGIDRRQEVERVLVMGDAL